MSLRSGLTAAVDHQVTDADTAVALGSGDVEVLGTPKVCALCEQAAVAAVAGELEAGQTTVGTRLDVEHLAPTPVGGRVSAHAELVSVDARTLAFTVEVTDDTGEVARGTHTRVVVDRERFVRGASAR